jgi:WhiB family transcriptional regulator, redox-sensing transcriptional regulator
MNEALIGWLMSSEASATAVTLEEMLRRPEWHQRAACRGVGPSDYVRGRGANYESAKTVCGDCPVRQECLDVALADESLVGLWGGTTEAERREIRRARVA